MNRSSILLLLSWIILILGSILIKPFPAKLIYTTMLILNSFGIYLAIREKSKVSLSLNIITVILSGGILYLMFVGFMGAIK